MDHHASRLYRIQVGKPQVTTKQCAIVHYNYLHFRYHPLYACLAIELRVADSDPENSEFAAANGLGFRVQGLGCKVQGLGFRFEG